MDEVTSGYVPTPLGTTMTHSPSLDALAAALAKAQGSMHGAKKDSENPFFKSDYADLESVWKACRSALSENGLSVIQTTSNAEAGTPAITTMLLHASGQWIRDTLTLFPKANDPQGMGSAITYGRRYALAAMVGVYQTDDDAEATKKPLGPSQDEVKALSQKWRDVHKAKIDGKALELHEEVNHDESLYRAAWHLLAADVRAELKRMIERARATNGTAHSAA